jgi:hypothetical protein
MTVELNSFLQLRNFSMFLDIIFFTLFNRVLSNKYIYFISFLRTISILNF